MRNLLILLAAILILGSVASAQDPTKWYVLDGVKDDGNWCHFASNVAQAGGMLTMTQGRGSYTCSPGGTAVPASTGMMFSNPASFTGGVFKASVRFGTSTGTEWSAFWLWGGGPTSSGYPSTCIAAVQSLTANTMSGCTTSSVLSYEVDIAEDQNTTRGVHGSLITWNSGAATQLCPVGAFGGLNGAFHTYEIDWYPSLFVWKVDGVASASCAVSFTQPMFIIFDQEVRGGTITSYTTDIQWVRHCSDPNSACMAGDPSIDFEDNFETPTVTPNYQGIAATGVKLEGLPIGLVFLLFGLTGLDWTRRR